MITRLVGRDQELARLTELLGDVAERKPAVVVIDGEPGVGKSRLVAEFTARARESGAVVLAGGCLALEGGAIPYGPLVEALRLLVRQLGEEKARELAGPPWAELAGLIADFTGFPEPAPPTMGAQTRVFGAVSRMLDHIGSHAPLVLVFEDVHWADTATLDLIAYLALTTSDQRMMLVCSYRSGLPLGHPLRARLAEPEFTRRRHRISLVPFTSMELRAFVSAVTGEDVSPERADRYFELSEGNPYFTEQLLAAGPGQVPESLTDLMHARLSRLSPDAASLVRVAAVAGRRVSDSLLARIADLDDAALDAALTECVDEGVLIEERVDESYRFQHALLRETAYGTVRSRERKRLHAALAEELAGEVALNPHVLPELAYHWSAADRVPEALRAAVLAGDLAVRVRAFQEAENQYRRALELWSEPVAEFSRVRVLKVAADAARWAGHLEQAVAWASEAVACAPDDGELYERLGSYRWEAGFESEDTYREAHRLLSAQPPSAAGSRVRSALATAEAKRGNYSEALVLARQAEKEAVEAGAQAEVGRARNSSGLALTLLGDHALGVADLRSAQEIAASADHLEDLLRASGNLGVCLERAGQVSEAVEVFQHALARSRELGVLGSRQAGLLANNACATLFLIGRWDEASVLIREVLRYHPLRETTFQRLTKAEVDLATGRVAEAEQLLESVRNHPSRQPRFLSPLYRCLAELAAKRGDPEGALATVRRGVEAIASTEDRLLTMQLCAFGLGVAADEAERGNPLPFDDLLAHLGTTDDPETAVLAALCAAEAERCRGADTPQAWQAIAKSWRELDRPYPMAYALARLAGAAARAGEKDLAASAASEAAEIADRLGAAPLSATIQRIGKAHRLFRRAAPSDHHPFNLTQREVDVLRELAKGLTNRAIGTRLHISKDTVGTHLSNAYRKLGVDSKIPALDKVRDAGLLD